MHTMMTSMTTIKTTAKISLIVVVPIWSMCPTYSRHKMPPKARESTGFRCHLNRQRPAFASNDSNNNNRCTDDDAIEIAFIGA